MSLAGVGLHGGRPCRATLAPAPPGHGYRVNGGPATIAHVADARLATTLRTPAGDVRVVEHLLAALALAGVDDVAITVEGGEVPILDGSAAPWLAALAPHAHGGERRPVTLRRPLRLGDADAWIEAAPAAAFSARVTIDFPGLGAQAAEDLAACADARTFGFLRDAEALRARGLALGADLDNTVVFDDAGRCQNPGGLRGADEPARHKLLDLLGDLALLGAPLCARVTAHRAGHALHHALVRALAGGATSSP